MRELFWFLEGRKHRKANKPLLGSGPRTFSQRTLQESTAQGKKNLEEVHHDNLSLKTYGGGDGEPNSAAETFFWRSFERGIGEA